MTEWRIRVEGRVQGVGFRAAVQKIAHLHQIHGYARNCTDGSVEICAQGIPAQLKKFLSDLHQQPGLSHITVDESAIVSSFSSFEIH